MASDTQRAAMRPARRRGGILGRVLLYSAVALAALAVAYPLAIRPWHLRWGATDAEVNRALPGDEIVPNPVYQATRAITINAPVEAVWPWLVQIGQGRGGMYSYDWLENLIACDMHSADRIISELQNPKVGDIIRMVPEPYVLFGQEVKGGPRYVVAAVQPSRAFVLRVPTQADAPMDGTWQFVLEPVDKQTTRLFARTRSYSEPAWVAPLVGVEPIAFVMEREMLRGLKDRAERH